MVLSEAGIDMDIQVIFVVRVTVNITIQEDYIPGKDVTSTTMEEAYVEHTIEC